MALTDNLVAYWKLDDDLVDAHASFDLTDSGSTGFAAGKINNGADFGGSTFLLYADDPAFEPGDSSFAIQAWVKLGDKSTTRGIVGKSGGSEEYFLSYDQSVDRFQFWIHNTDYRIVNADALGSPSTGTWYHLIGQYDASTDTVQIYVNAGAGDSLGSVTPGPSGGSDDFRIGAYNPAAARMIGVIDEVGFWSGRTLDSTDRSNLYNGGSGLAYPLIPAGSNPPNATYATDTQLCEGSDGTITPTNTGDAITSSAVASGTLPTGYTLNANGTISKVGASMLAADIGSRTVYVNLTNAAGTQSNVPVPIVITANPPQFHYAGSPFAKYVAYGSSTANVTVDGGPAVKAAGYSLSAAMSGLSLNTTSGQLTFNPAADDITTSGGMTLTVSGESAGGQVGTATITVAFGYQFTVEGSNAGGSDTSLVTLWRGVATEGVGTITLGGRVYDILLVDRGGLRMTYNLGNQNR